MQSCGGGAALSTSHTASDGGKTESLQTGTTQPYSSVERSCWMDVSALYSSRVTLPARKTGSRTVKRCEQRMCPRISRHPICWKAQTASFRCPALQDPGHDCMGLSHRFGWQACLIGCRAARPNTRVQVRDACTRRMRTGLPGLPVLSAVALVGDAAHGAHHHRRAAGEHLIRLRSQW